MGKIRLKVVLRCTHCRARVRLDESTAGKLADDPGLMIHCSHCEREFCATPAPAPAPTAPEPAAVAVKPPPFGDLVRDSEPAPPFSPLEAVEVPDEPARNLTLAERWNAVPPRRQRVIVGAAICAMVVAVMAWPVSGNPPALSATQPDPVPPPQREAPPPSPPPIYLVLTTERVPLNTKVTPENASKFFRTTEVVSPLAKAVKAPQDVIGKYVVQELSAGSIAYESAFADKPIALPPPSPPPAPPPPLPSDPLPERITRIVGQFTITEITLVEVAPGKWTEKSKRVYPTGQVAPGSLTPQPQASTVAPPPGANVRGSVFFNPFEVEWVPPTASAINPKP